MRCAPTIVIAVGTWFALNPAPCMPAEPAEPPYQANVPPNDNREEFARGLLSDYAFVGLGYVSIDYSTLPKEFYKQRPRRVVAQFDPVRIYKGEASDGSISIDLRSDMLVVPGENISAGVKRDRLWADLDRRRSENKRSFVALEASLARGRIGPTEYENEKTRLGAISSRISRESSQLSTVSGTVSGAHIRTFFDLDGAIKPDELYLLSVNPKRNQQGNTESEIVYDLPIHLTSLLWGQLRDETVGALERLAPPGNSPAR